MLYANERGGQILDGADGLACCNGRVTAMRPQERRRLAALVEAAALRHGLRGGSLRVPRRQRGASWAVIVMPAPDDLTQDADGSAALLRVVDLNTRPPPPARRLAEIFGLSGAEARLAAEIAAGAAPERIAERRGVKITTVRSQLRAVFAKTGTSRQSELVSLLSRIADPPEPDDQGAAGGAISR